ncbi:DUF3558 family protein [Actinoalloteichus hymeniacidonis]|uniref:DUF3558 family protein n=1 Tax=Actinoalloteichus hymeniacidonis TaxID=340345 RepID=UPI0015619D34|nr:DUF3558 family protein [Actinoalloteichus hymeniacidonis]MBB5906552.1 hypothetical protein [Actinoalloteichus hymeniacidonis]
MRTVGIRWRVGGLVAAGALLLAACTTQEAGRAAPAEGSAPPPPEMGDLLEQSQEPTDEAEGDEGSEEPSESESLEPPPDDVEPNPHLDATTTCDYLTDEMLDDIGISGPSSYREGDRGRGNCIIVDMETNGDLGVGVSLNPYGGLDDWNLDGLTEASSTEVGGRAAREVRTQGNMCAIDVAATDTSSVRVLATNPDLDAACETAAQAAGHVIPALPAEAFE